MFPCTHPCQRRTYLAFISTATQEYTYNYKQAITSFAVCTCSKPSSYCGKSCLLALRRRKTSSFFIVARYAMQGRPMSSCGVRTSVCLSRSWTLSKRINVSSNFSPSGSETILVFLYRTSWQSVMGHEMHVVGNISRSQPISGSIACCVRLERQVQYTGKRRSFLMVGDDEEVYGKKPQRNAEENGTVFNCMQW